MFKKIKVYFLSKKKLTEQNKALNDEIVANRNIMTFISNKATAELVIEKVMKRGINWYDYSELSDNDRKIYFNEIQSVITNKSFINELNHLLADQVEYIARESKSHEDTMNIRMTINAISLIKERLESVIYIEPEKPSDENTEEAV
jgi:hypothetical protein